MLGLAAVNRRSCSSSSHELFFRAIGTDDVLAVRDEALAGHGHLAERAHEALRVPVPPLERDEPGAAGAGDGLGAGGAPLGEEVSEALSAVGLVGAGGELLAGQHGVAVGAGEALAVPGLVLEGHPARGHDLLALVALGGELVLEAGDAVHVVVVGDDEGLRAHGHLAHRALQGAIS